MPRISSIGEDLNGKVCACSLGRVGVVYGKKTLTFPADNKTVEVHAGFGLDGNGLWATGTGNPVVVLAESLAEYGERVASRPSNVLYGQIAVQPAKS